MKKFAQGERYELIYDVFSWALEEKKERRTKEYISITVEVFTASKLGVCVSTNKQSVPFTSNFSASDWLFPYGNDAKKSSEFQNKNIILKGKNHKNAVKTEMRVTRNILLPKIEPGIL